MKTVFNPPTEPPPPSKEIVRAARRSADLTQTEAAALIYRTRRNWQQWESDERRMDAALFELFLIKTRTLRRHEP